MRDMTMGLKVRRILDEDIKKKAKKHRDRSDAALETVYSKLVESFKDRKDTKKKAQDAEK